MTDKRILLYILVGIVCLMITGCFLPSDSTGATFEENMRFHAPVANMGVSYGYDCKWDEVDIDTCYITGHTNFLNEMKTRNIPMEDIRKDAALHTYDIGIMFVYGMCHKKDLSIPDCQDATVEWIEEQLWMQLK